MLVVRYSVTDGTNINVKEYDSQKESRLRTNLLQVDSPPDPSKNENGAGYFAFDATRNVAITSLRDVFGDSTGDRTLLVYCQRALGGSPGARGLAFQAFSRRSPIRSPQGCSGMGRERVRVRGYTSRTFFAIVPHQKSFRPFSLTIK
jgi:hypothetical protein